MSFDPISTVGIAKAIGTHAAKWLHNLARAGQARQLESLRAIDKVIPALRMTEAYTRGVAKGQTNHSTEADIAFRWSELAAELEALGLKALAKKCDIKGRFWADPEQFDSEFLRQAGVDLKTVEKLAREVRTRIKLGARQ